jgi:glycosyltransferase involved in cell wall biosynthesis
MAQAAAIANQEGSIRPKRIQRPLKILHIASGDLWAGAESQIYHLIAELQRQPAVIEVSVILLNRGDLESRLRAAGIPVTVINEATNGALGIFRQFRHYFSKHAVDVVHTHGYKQNVIGTLALASLGRYNSVRTEHGAMEFQISPWQLHKLAIRALDRLCGQCLQRYVIAVSDAMKGNLDEIFGANKVALIENGLAVDEVRKVARETVAIPGRQESFKVALVGRLVPVKRVDLFLKLARRMIERSEKDYEFYVFGDGPLLKDMINLANSLSIQANVHFMGFQANLAPYLRQMDTMVIISDHEGLPMTLLEAMCLRVPVVAHAVGGIPTVLENGRAGELVEDQDIDKFVIAIERLSQNPGVGEEYRQRGEVRVADHYSVQRVARETLAVYSDIYGKDEL